MSSLLRSTKFVRYFAGAARTLILNSAKSAENNLLLNSKALGVANNVLMRDYASKKESLDPLLLRLDSEVRRYGRISKRDIDEVFDELRAKSNITSSQSLLVIRCCGELVPEELPEQRTLLVQKIWSVLTERGVPMDISHYNALLRVYIENEHAFSPAEFLEELEKKGLQPNRVTYQRLMWRYCQEGDVEGATKVLERMRELHFPVSEPVLNALIMGHAYHGDTDGAKAVLQTMAGAGLQPSNRSYSLLACGFAKKGDIEGIENTFNTAIEQDVFLSDKDVLDVIEALALSGHGDKIETIFPHLPRGAGFITDVCNVVLKLINKGQENVAKTLMKTMPNNDKEQDTLYKGAFFVKQLVKMNKSAEATVKICKELQAENLIPNALYIATEGALQQGNSGLATELFKELQKAGLEIRLHYYWPLLAKKGKENDEEGLLQLLRDMAHNGLSPTGETLRDYVIPYLIKKASPQNVITKLQIGNIPAIHAARNVMVELLYTGKIKDAAEIAQQYQPFGQFNLISRPLINSLAKSKDVKSFVTVLHVISSRAAASEQDSVNDEAPNDDKTDDDVGKIVKTAIKNIPATLVDELLTELLTKGLSISTQSAEQIQQYLGQDLTGSISEKLTQLTATDLEIAPLGQARRNNTGGIRNSAYLERLVEQAKAKDENAHRLQKQLITLYVQENNVQKLTTFLEDLKNQDFEVTNATLAQLFEFYCNNDQIEKALEIKQKLDAAEPRFLLNKIKIIHMAYALVRANKPDEALKFLKENESEHHALSEFVLNSKCWQMLNYLAEQKNVEKVKELTQALIEHHYAEPSNVLLGPSIKVHLLVSDISGALSEFERCCKVYRSTPWKGELMKALILKEDATRLQWLADLSTQIHGEVNILHDLVLAFVECGRLRQARRILETPGMQTRQRRLDDAAQRYVQEGKSEYLEGLLEATKELSHIDRSNIFYHLLVTYCKANETDKALGLWTLLQEDGEIPSEQFLSHLGTHLKEKNRPIPFVIPQSATPNVPNTHKTDIKPEIRITKKESTSAVEQLVNEGKLNQATEYAIRSIKEGTVPKAAVLKYLLRNLALSGDVAGIEAIGKELGDPMKRNVTYDDKLTQAVFNKGAGDKHVQSLYKSVQSANTREELDEALKGFPKSTALASIVEKKGDLLNQCHDIALLAASKGHYMPANLLWMEYLLAGNTQEADAIFTQHLSKATSIAFRRLLQESHNRNDATLIEKLISDLKTNTNITPAAIGNPYSRLVNLYLACGETKKATEALDKALGEGIALDNINRNSLKKLKAAVESAGQEFKHAVN